MQAFPGTHNICYKQVCPGEKGEEEEEEKEAALARKNSKPEKIQMDGATEAKRTARQIEEGVDQRRY